ncbi:hypothetical protein KBD34_04025 [Patescibacteria group bacterium]|nr:hypothetical protein [Patescibacteria group bacterium]
MLSAHTLRDHLGTSLGVRHGAKHPATIVAMLVTLISGLGSCILLLFPETVEIRTTLFAIACLAVITVLGLLGADFVYLTGTHRSMVEIGEGGGMDIFALSRPLLRWNQVKEKDAVVFCFTPGEVIKLVIPSENRDKWGHVTRQTRLTVFFKIVPDASSNTLDDDSIRRIIRWLSDGFEESTGARWKHLDDVKFLQDIPRECVVIGKELEILVPLPQATVTATK